MSTDPRARGSRGGFRWAPGFLGLALLAACISGEDPVVCTADVRPGLDIEVQDGVDGALLCDAIVVASDAQEEVLAAGPDCRYRGAWERPGTYDVTADHKGYATGRATGLVVDADVCHVIEVQRTIVLLP